MHIYVVCIALSGNLVVHTKQFICTPIVIHSLSYIQSFSQSSLFRSFPISCLLFPLFKGNKMSSAFFSSKNVDIFYKLYNPLNALLSIHSSCLTCSFFFIFILFICLCLCLWVYACYISCCWNIIFSSIHCYGHAFQHYVAIVFILVFDIPALVVNTMNAFPTLSSSSLSLSLYVCSVYYMRMCVSSGTDYYE